MDPVDLVHARGRLDALHRRVRETVGAAVVLAVAATVAAAFGHAQLARVGSTDLLTRLVAQGDAGLFTEAEDYARKLAAPTMRLRLARGLERAAAAGRPGLHEYTWVRPERVFDVRDELLRLSAAFGDLAVAITPMSAALCRRMLCEAAASPLYNPKIPEAELARLLRVFGADIEPRH